MKTERSIVKKESVSEFVNFMFESHKVRPIQCGVCSTVECNCPAVESKLLHSNFVELKKIHHKIGKLGSKRIAIRLFKIEKQAKSFEKNESR